MQLKDNKGIHSGKPQPMLKINLVKFFLKFILQQKHKFRYHNKHFHGDFFCHRGVEKHMLWVLTESIPLRCFLLISTTKYFNREFRKKYITNIWLKKACFIDFVFV